MSSSSHSHSEALSRFVDTIEKSAKDDPHQQEPETEQLADETQFLDQKRKELEVREYQENIDARKLYAYRAFVLVAIWLAMVLFTVWASGAKFTLPNWYPSCMPVLKSFQLPAGVIVTLIGSTTANILGILAIIYTYLFPKNARSS